MTLEKEKLKKTTNSHNKNSEPDISHEIEPTDTSNSQGNTENNDNAGEENVTLQKPRDISREKKYYSKFHGETY